VAQNAKKPQLIVLDTNVLLDLADEAEFAWDCIHTLKQRLGPRFVIPPTVIQEPADLSELNDTDAESFQKRALAEEALDQILSWGFQPINFLPVEHGIVEQIGLKVRNRGLLPATEENDSLIIAEAALLGVTILVSSDNHILEIDATFLKLELDSFDVATPLIASPRKIVNSFFPRG
jgi:predicted nucleic acid-binding protein